MKQLQSIQRLIASFTKLPGVGQKTAQRYAYRIVEMPKEEANDFIAAILDVKNNVKYCKACGNFAEQDTCEICRVRDKSVICVVAYPKDILAIDRVGSYKGVYHVLGGLISPLEGKSPDDLSIKALLQRLDGVDEVIIATNPDVEGEATAAYISRLIKPLGIKVSRIAQGISMGSDIEYADEYTLSKALQLRTEL